MPESVRTYGLSALLTAAVIGTFFGLGLRFHDEHSRAGTEVQRLLVASAGQFAGAPLMPTATEHHVVGYADLTSGGEQSCAAEASVVLITGHSTDIVRTALVPAHLPNVTVDRLGSDAVRVRVYRAFGQNPLDWSCWQ